MLLYAEHITPRLTYIIDYLAHYVFLTPITITQRRDEALQYDGAVINYSRDRIRDNEWFLRPSGLLEGKGIRNVQPPIAFFEDRTVLFPQVDSDFPFDVFSALFYVLSRYEEYLDNPKDTFGRFSHEQSIAWKYHFLKIPLADYWVEDFKKSLQQRYPHIIFRRSEFSFTPTYDIDIAWSYLHKGWYRNAGGLTRDLLQLKTSAVVERIRVLAQGQRDPYDVYDWLENIHSAYHLKPIYFFLLSNGSHPLDKNIHPRRKALRNLLNDLSNTNTIGVHPSMESNADNDVFIKELAHFKEITGQAPACSRQHYLYVQLPDTYRQLIAAGIQSDYSMGYGTVNGFRASTSKSFLWYDLLQETSTPLRLFPFAFMDANAFYVSKSDPAATLQELIDLYGHVKAVNGQFITVFHNHILGTGSQFRGWKEMYCAFLDYVSRTNV